MNFIAVLVILFHNTRFQWIHKFEPAFAYTNIVQILHENILRIPKIPRKLKLRMGCVYFIENALNSIE